MGVEQAETGLIALAAQGLLERFWLPGEGKQPGQWLVCLTRRGARKAKELVGRQVRCLRIDNKASVFVHHQLAVSQAVASLVAELGSASDLIVGNQLAAGLKGGARSSPDAYLAFRVAQALPPPRTVPEVDCGTEGRRQRRSSCVGGSFYLDEHRRSWERSAYDRLHRPSRSREWSHKSSERHCRVRRLSPGKPKPATGIQSLEAGATLSGEVCGLVDPC
jgi:hypothetical protein